MTPIKKNLSILQGATFRYPFYWYSDVEVVKVITAVTRTYPSTFTVTAHGIAATSEVPVAILDVGEWIDTGLDKANRIYAKRVDDDNFSVKVDSTEEDAYSGTDGRLLYNAPMALATGWSARMKIRAAKDDPDVIQAFTTGDNTIVLGDDGKIELDLTDDDTDALDFTSAVYDLELEETATGDVFRVAEGKVTLSKQATYT